MLLELAGDCPGDPDARPVRVTACEGPHDALGPPPSGSPPAGPRRERGATRPARVRCRGVARARLDAGARVARPRLPADAALAVVAHAAAARPERFCLFPNPTARR